MQSNSNTFWLDIFWVVKSSQATLASKGMARAFSSKDATSSIRAP
jgi:hypothetical protein